MNKVSIFLKVLFNTFLFLFYSLFSIIAWNFVFWLILTLLGKDVPQSWEEIHLKLAILVLFLTLIFTLLFRRFFYLRTFDNEVNKIIKNEIKKEEDLEIYVNKEIK